MFDQDFRAGRLVIRPSLNRVERDGQPSVRLRPKSMEVLAFLAARPGRVATRDELLSAVWPGVNVAEEGLTRCIAEIREALGDDVRRPIFIETVPKRGYRLIVPVEAIPITDARARPFALTPAVDSLRHEFRPGVALPAPSAPRRALARMAIAIPVVALAVGLGYAAVTTTVHNRNVRWARETALPEIDRQVARDQWPAAFSLARRTEEYIPADSLLAEAFKAVAVQLSVRSEPPGASVYLREYGGTALGPWTLLGTTPVSRARVSRGRKQYRIVKAGCDEVRGTTGTDFRMAQFPQGTTLEVVRILPRRGTTPAGMTWVDGGTITPQVFRSARWPAVELPPFLIETTEVTNRRYQAFLDAGGYRDRRYWTQPIERDGRALPWEEAMAAFVDQTGRQGPASWEGGHYPVGQESFPVGGVSWYEAMAFAEFEGKRLPTVYHWNKAVGTLTYISPGWDGVFDSGRPVSVLSNFGQSGPRVVGSMPGMGPYGTEDMAGNVSEWAWNAVGDRRMILGGAWNDSPLAFTAGSALNPLDRTPTNGLRLVKDASGTTVPATAMVPIRDSPDRLRDVRLEPVPESVFDALRGHYRYDRPPLEHRIDASSATASPYFVRERVSFNAAYDGERIIAYIYLPKGVAPPYQAVIYSPGSDALRARSIDEYPYMEAALFVRSGRAVVFPVYWGTFERGGTPRAAATSALQLQERLVKSFKDLARTIDYLETRPDIDATRLSFFGLSAGASVGPIFGALEPRLRVFILTSLGPTGPHPPTDWVNFAPRMKAPVLVLNGRYYDWCPESCAARMVELFGASRDDKRLILAESGYIVPMDGQACREILSWLDRYLGPVQQDRPR
jgi:eukaryotic-like serine/threonine-protein kinase